jgi:hypothetical protein
VHAQMHRPPVKPPGAAESTAKPRGPVRRPIVSTAAPSEEAPSGIVRRKQDGGVAAVPPNEGPSPAVLVQRRCAACAEEEHKGPAEERLAVSHPHDPLESEADRVAERVMRAADPAALDVHPVTSGVSRALARKSTSTAPSGEGAAPMVQGTLRSSGEPLSASTRAFMEPRFGRGFGDVRVHTDAQASRSAESVSALAYTVGDHIVFRAGQYAPETPAGQRLLAHELTHVAQQAHTSPTWGSASAPVQRTPGERAPAAEGATEPAKTGAMTATAGNEDEDAAREKMKRQLGSAQKRAGSVQGALSGVSALSVTPAESSRVNGLYASLRGGAGKVSTMPAVHVPSVSEPEEEADAEHSEDVEPAGTTNAAAPAVPILAALAVIAILAIIVTAIVVLVARVLSLLGTAKRPPIEAYVLALILQVLMAIQTIIDKVSPKPKRASKAVPRTRRGTPWGEAPRRSQQAKPRRGAPRKGTDPKLAPDITIDPRKRDKDDPRPDCCQTFVPISQIRVRKRGRAGIQIVTIKDTRGKHTKNAAGCDVQTLHEVTTHDPQRYGVCLQGWIGAVGVKDLDYGGQMGSDSAARYAQIAQKIIETGTELRGNKYWGNAGEPVGVDVTTGQVTNNARVDGVPNEAHIIPKVAP